VEVNGSEVNSFYVRIVFMKIILASASLGRKQLLESLKVPFEVMTAEIDEEKIVDQDPVKMAVKRAVAKAESAAQKIQGNKGNMGNQGKIIIIGADTVGFLDSWVFGKPNSRKEAEEMLGKLSGKTHKYVSAHALIKLKAQIANRKTKNDNSKQKSQFSVLGCQLSERGLSDSQFSVLKADKPKTDKLISENRKLRTDNCELIADCDIASVTLRKLTTADIRFYLDRVPYTKLCGAIQIMHSPQNFVVATEGSLSTIIGLCLEKVVPILQKENLV
jgi:predicted house-cleaning NTP pyrophosphatase (Maf/HAM1 superfamily)